MRSLTKGSARTAHLACLALAMGACVTGEIGGPGGSAGSAGAIDPGPVYLRRLTNAEYTSAVRDVLGVDPTAVVATFPADVVTSGFDNASLTQTISTVHSERYLAAAQAFGQEVVSTPALRDKVLGCDPASGDRLACMRSFIERFGRRIYRRPLPPAEVDRFVALSDMEADPHQAASMVIEAALQSPRFLFRVEIGVVDPDRADRVRLTGYEVATRLSFFLWGSTPDDALLDAAESGALDTTEGVAAEARRMIGDPRLADAMRSFTAQWFRLGHVTGAQRDPQQFPELTASLREAMAEELQHMLQEFMWSDGASFLDIYTTRRGWVNAELASHYGVTPPAGESFAPLEWGGDPDRGGLFTTAAFLTATTRGNASSPIQRGKHVREMALCDPLPAPPGGIPPVEQMPGETAADAEERHTRDPLCANCHVRIDPIGHGLEKYDSIGALRSTYTSGAPVREDGFIHGLEGSEFSGGVELGAIVRGSEMGQLCVVAQTFRWALGRVEARGDTEDGPTLGKLQSSFAASGFRFPDLVVALATSDAFRYRRLPD